MADSPMVCTMIGDWQRVLKRNRAYGESTRMARARGGDRPAIRSCGDERHLLTMGAAFWRFCHSRFGTRRFSEARPHHGAAWVADAEHPNTQKARLVFLRRAEGFLRSALRLRARLVPSDMAVERVKTSTGGLTPEERAAIVAFAGGKNPALAAALQYGANSGLRPGEIVKVQVGAYNPATGQLAVPPIKWAHGRTVQVPTELQPEYDRLTAGRAAGEPLFPGVSIRGLQRIVAAASDALGLPPGPDGGKRTPMAFRGSFATEEYERALDEGLNDADARRRVAQQLGHGHEEVRPRIDVAQQHYIKRRGRG